MSWFKSLWNALTTSLASGRHRNPAAAHNFTPQAQQILAMARQEAARLKHDFVGTEHLLLGLIKLGQGVAVKVLQHFRLDLDKLRSEVEKHVAGPRKKPGGNLPFVPRVKKVLALAAREAKTLNHAHVGTEHILLGLLLEGESAAARILKKHGINIEHTRQEILKEVSPQTEVPPMTAP
jgi:ATP-dependent Clp protease ATP-binding subunit ClpC